MEVKFADNLFEKIKEISRRNDNSYVAASAIKSEIVGTRLRDEARVRTEMLMEILMDNGRLEKETIFLGGGRNAMGYRPIAKYREEIKPEEGKSIINECPDLSTELEDLKDRLSGRAYSALMNHYKTVRDVRAVPDNELLCIRGLGKTTLRNIREVTGKCDLTLKSIF